MHSRTDDDQDTMNLTPIVTYIKKAFKYTQFLYEQYLKYLDKQKFINDNSFYLSDEYTEYEKNIIEK